MIERATSNGSKRKQTDDRQSFVNVSILSVLHSSTSPLKKKTQMKLTVFDIFFNAVGLLPIADEKHWQSNVHI
jgi:hypothetical protein